MAKIEVPPIPRDITEALDNKTLGPADIKWIKSVNDNVEYLETADEAHKDDRKKTRVSAPRISTRTTPG